MCQLRRYIQDTSASRAFSYRLCVDCQPSGPTRCRSANQRCWMSKSSTSTLHRGALGCTRPRTPREPASNGSKLGGTLHNPEQSSRLRAAHRVREPLTSRWHHRGAQVPQKRYNCSAEYPSRDATRFSALPCQHKPWCSQGRSQ
jgi:hypothetical protein